MYVCICMYVQQHYVPVLACVIATHIKRTWQTLVVNAAETRGGGAPGCICIFFTILNDRHANEIYIYISMYMYMDMCMCM
jgi:hypothetical protein